VVSNTPKQDRASASLSTDSLDFSIATGYQTREPSSPPQTYAPRAQRYELQVGEVRNLQMPDGRTVTAAYKGQLTNATELPTRGGQLGDTYRIGDHVWVLTTLSANNPTVAWLDP
jgi:hypothetical protein